MQHAYQIFKEIEFGQDKYPVSNLKNIETGKLTKSYG